MQDRLLAGAASRRQTLGAEWEICHAAAGAAADPQQLQAMPGLRWEAVGASSTVARALHDLGRIDEDARRLDADDWWFRLRFDAGALPAGGRRWLRFAGLATLARVWLNGQALLDSDNMHLAHDCEVPALRLQGNELLLRFASMEQALQRKRPRPRWRTPMVAHQQLRWLRTTMIGRTPGWSPPWPAVGPWRGIVLLDVDDVAVRGLRLSSRLVAGQGEVAVRLSLEGETPPGSVQVRLELERAGARHGVALAGTGRPGEHAGTLTVPDAEPWWPHTHGEPALYAARLLLSRPDGTVFRTVALSPLGFRTVSVDQADGGFSLCVNGVPVFCRGANWTPDAIDLHAPATDCDAVLRRFRDAGLNMLRVNGAMVYESEHFHDACDRLGILLWQDFMFANMDYPLDDPQFAQAASDEAVQQLSGWQGRPSIAVLCGNSEASQQAAMWGAPRSQWLPAWFERDLAGLCAHWCPDVPYWPTSAHGGAFPHRNDRGTTSYYGVGAYLRPLDDARRSAVKFATECLALANVPSPAALARLPGGAAVRVHQAAWRERAPRDLGAGWDFDDVRDHYLRQLFGVDPAAVRARDHERYLALSRAVSAELMRATFSEWRRPDSACRGGLVLFLRDLWAGAGWGLLDELGQPKAAFHGLREASAPQAVFLSDEGTNGLDVHLSNERPQALEAAVELALYRADGHCIECAVQQVTIPPRQGLTLSGAQWFERWIDLNDAYGFGPPAHALVVATLRAGPDRPLAQAFHVLGRLPSERDPAVLPQGVFRVDGDADGSVEVTLRCDRFAAWLHFDVPGFVPDAAYFHLAPHVERRVRFVPVATPAPSFDGRVMALNGVYPGVLKPAA
jgi:beta-mannosidase